MVSPGYALFFWSPPEGCWAVLAVGEDRERVEHLRERLAFFSEFETRILKARSCDDDDVAEVGLRLKPPASVDFIRPSACGE